MDGGVDGLAGGMPAVVARVGGATAGARVGGATADARVGGAAAVVGGTKFRVGGWARYAHDSRVFDSLGDEVYYGAGRRRVYPEDVVASLLSRRKVTGGGAPDSGAPDSGARVLWSTALANACSRLAAALRAYEAKQRADLQDPATALASGYGYLPPVQADEVDSLGTNALDQLRPEALAAMLTASESMLPAESGDIAAAREELAKIRALAVTGSVRTDDREGLRAMEREVLPYAEALERAHAALAGWMSAAADRITAEALGSNNAQ